MTKVLVYLTPLFHKKIIISITRHTGGCYIWVNLHNGKKYVGSSLDLSERIYDHLSGRNSNLLLQRAFMIYGHDPFKLIIIILPEASKESVLTLEQHLIDTLYPEYNLSPTAGSTAGAILGPQSAEHRAKLSAAASQSNKGKFPSDDSKLLISLSKGGSSVFIYDALSLELLCIRPSRYEAARYCNCNEITIRRYLKSGKAFRGYLFRTTPME